MANSLKDYLKESILDSVKEELNPRLWDKNKKLKRSVKVHIVKRLETWLKNYTDKTFKKLYLLGSNAGYQYNNSADIDVNFVIDITDEKLKELTKLLPNGSLLPGTEHPINYYISNVIKPEWKKQGSMYDIVSDRWVVEPSKEEKSPIIKGYRAVTEIARFMIAGLDSVITEYQTDVAAYESYNEFLSNAESEDDKEELKKLVQFKLNEIISDLDGIYIASHMLHALRKEAFKEESNELDIITKIDIKNANQSMNNIIYKYIEKLGYQKKVNDILGQRKEWENKLNGL